MNITFTVSLRTVFLCSLALFAFGVVYNLWVEHLQRQGHDRGYMSFIVALGVAVTGLGFTLATAWQLGLILLACFVASGAPMIHGSILRHVRERAQAEADLRRRALKRLSDRGD